MKTLMFVVGLCFATTALALTCSYGKVGDSIMIANVPLQTTKNHPQGPCFGNVEAPTKEKYANYDKNAPTSANFPKVDAATQKQRDGSRRQILQDELSSEQQALDQAHATNKADDVMLHEQNVKMLEQELSGLK
jgi:hypothetical protein